MALLGSTLRYTIPTFAINPRQNPYVFERTRKLAIKQPNTSATNNATNSATNTKSSLHAKELLRKQILLRESLAEIKEKKTQIHSKQLVLKELLKQRQQELRMRRKVAQELKKKKLLERQMRLRKKLSIMLKHAKERRDSMIGLRKLVIKSLVETTSDSKTLNLSLDSNPKLKRLEGGQKYAKKPKCVKCVRKNKKKSEMHRQSTLKLSRLRGGTDNAQTKEAAVKNVPQNKSSLVMQIAKLKSTLQNRRKNLAQIDNKISEEEQQMAELKRDYRSLCMTILYLRGRNAAVKPSISDISLSTDDSDGEAQALKGGKDKIARRMAGAAKKGAKKKKGGKKAGKKGKKGKKSKKRKSVSRCSNAQAAPVATTNDKNPAAIELMRLSDADKAVQAAVEAMTACQSAEAEQANMSAETARIALEAQVRRTADAAKAAKVAEQQSRLEAMRLECMKREALRPDGTTIDPADLRSMHRERIAQAALQLAIVAGLPVDRCCVEREMKKNQLPAPSQGQERMPEQCLQNVMTACMCGKCNGTCAMARGGNIATGLYSGRNAPVPNCKRVNTEELYPNAQRCRMPSPVANCKRANAAVSCCQRGGMQMPVAKGKRTNAEVTTPKNVRSCPSNRLSMNNYPSGYESSLALQSYMERLRAAADETNCYMNAAATKNDNVYPSNEELCSIPSTPVSFQNESYAYLQGNLTSEEEQCLNYRNSFESNVAELLELCQQRF